MYNPSIAFMALDIVETPIRDLMRRFNAMQGKLRVSVTHACQLECRFCHQEGIERHWQATHMSVEFFRSIVEAYAEIGGKYIEITGGEPTIHPKIGELVDSITNPDLNLILCTNGLRLDRLQEQVVQKKIDLIKLSLHATESSDSTKRLLGSAWDFSRLKKNVEQALRHGANFQVVFTHTKQNSRYLESVLQHALVWDVDLQVVDLISSRIKRPAEELGYVSGDEGERIVRQYAVLERVVSDRTGSILKLYRTPTGKSWEIKDFHYGVLHSSMCEGCTKRPECGEGIYALRIDATGMIKPCLLREDLQFRVAETKVKQAKTEFEAALRKMISGEMLWN
jgi:cyclic pyranopterin phosphate synthase